MAKRITITMTRAELLAFCFAAENILSAGSADEVQRFYGNEHTVKAAYRALKKVDAALKGEVR